MPGSEITSLIKYITDALSGINSFSHSDPGFKSIILGDLKNEIDSIDSNSNSAEYKRLKELFKELEELSEENKEIKSESKHNKKLTKRKVTSPRKVKVKK